MSLTFVSDAVETETIRSAHGLDEFLSSPFVSREALSGGTVCSLGELAADTDGAKTDDGGCCGAVDVWRGAYERWCAQRNVAPATACAFARAVRERFGLKTVPSGKRADIGGHRVQYRVFVDGPYANGRAGGGRPRTRVQASAPVSEFDVEPAASTRTLTNLDVDAYLSRKAQLEAYVGCGYMDAWGEHVAYDGASGPDSCELDASDVPFVSALADAFSERAMSGTLSRGLRVAHVVDALVDGRPGEFELPSGEHVVELSCRMPFPGRDGGETSLWCRLYLHLREAGAKHYGKAANSEIRDTFEISGGSVFSDDCLLGMSLSVFEDGFDGSCEYSFELPVAGFDYFGQCVVTSGYALYAIGDQEEVAGVATELSVSGRLVSERPLADTEPEAGILYVPVVCRRDDGSVDYMGGREPRQFGTWPYVRQVVSGSASIALAHPLKRPAPQMF